MAIRRHLLADAKVSEVVHEAEGVQQPNYDDDHYHSIQNGLDRALHRNEVIHQPKQHTHHDQDDQDLN